MQLSRGALVDRCHKCGTLLRRARAAQHAVLQRALEDMAMQLSWPPKEMRALWPNVKPGLHGPDWWWEMIIPAFDRLKKEEAQLMPAIDGMGFDGRGLDFVRGARRRRSLNDVEISEIIEYARAFGVDHGVKFREFEKRAA